VAEKEDSIATRQQAASLYLQMAGTSGTRSTASYPTWRAGVELDPEKPASLVLGDLSCDPERLAGQHAVPLRQPFRVAQYLHDPILFWARRTWKESIHRGLRSSV
jgi:hypothetical protein